MKRLITLLTAAGIILSLAACGNTQSGTSDATAATFGGNTAKTGGKAVSVYFSRVGNTDLPEKVDVITSATLNKQNGE